MPVIDSQPRQNCAILILVMAPPILPQPTLRGKFEIAAWAFYARSRILTGAPGWFLLDAAQPILTTAIPMFLGWAVSAGDPAVNFAARVGTTEYAAFMLVGANVFLLTLRAFWDIGLWLRNEQQAGTLELLYTTPADRRWILVGLAAFNLGRGLATLALSLLVGAWVFGIPLGGRGYLLAVLFLAVGVVPLYALSLLYGVVVLHLKETNALIQVALALLSMVIGIYYPVTMLPALARSLALLVPPAWIAHDLRAALLGTGYLLGAWPLDLTVLLGMALLGPPLAFAMLRRSERSLQGGRGLGEF
jgi:ABC-2 type transport system permease protein